MDYTKFEQEQFTPRGVEVEVPSLARWFPDGEKPVWKLRCVSASEMFYAKQAEIDSQKTKNEMIDEFMGGNVSKETIETIKAEMGLAVNHDDAPVQREVVFRRHLLMYATIPRCPENVALKLSNECGIVFTLLTNKILKLYGVGNLPGELKGSGGARK